MARQQFSSPIQINFLEVACGCVNLERQTWFFSNLDRRHVLHLTKRSSTIAGDLAGGALVIADVEFLDVAEFGAGLRGSGDFGDEDTVSVETPNKMIFQ